MPSWNKNPYGLRNGRIVSVEDLDENLEYGLRCNCICPSCGDILVARIHGKKKEKHFAHKGGADCGKAYESALHRMAKKIIEDGVEIKLPPIASMYGDKGFVVINEEIKYPASYSSNKPITPDGGETVIEKDMGSFRPDVSIKYKGNELFIEIQVTHPVDDEKKKLIQEKKISCVEFDFSYYKNDVLEESDIRSAFEGKDERIEARWIYNRIIDEHDSEIQSNLEVSRFFHSYRETPKLGTPLSQYGFIHKIGSKDRILNCPKRKHLDGRYFYANKTECNECKYFSGFLSELESAAPPSIICSKGDNNVKVYPDDAARFLLSVSNKSYLPYTEEECEEIIESYMKKLGPIAEHADVKKARNQAVQNMLSRFEERKKKEEKERRDERYKALYSLIYRRLNSLVFWANSIFEIWSKFAFNKVLDDLPEYQINEFEKEEVESIIFKLARKVWDSNCNEGERLYGIREESFLSVVSHLIEEPIYCHESQKDWLHRITSDLIQKNHGSFRFIIPIRQVKAGIREISILPFLEKTTKTKFEQKGTHEINGNGFQKSHE